MPKMRLIPPLSDGWFLHDYSVGADGRLARLCASVDPEDRLAHWRKNQVSWAESLEALIAAGIRLRIDLFDEAEVVTSLEFPFETLFPKFDRLPDGRWVVANARCWAGETNARILAPDGAMLSRTCLGDGIAYLQCDAIGGIWVGYFDEGVAGNLGWGGPGNPEPVGVDGVMRFTVDGVVSWSPGALLHPSIFDCYAMNVGYDGVWVYYYTDFPIVHVPFDGVLRQWRNNEVQGARLVAADRDLAVLLGGYQVRGYPDESGTGALLRLGENGRAEVLHRFLLDPSMKAALNNRYAFARGVNIHFIQGQTWNTMSVQDFAEGLASIPPRFPPYVPSSPDESMRAGPGWTLG